MAHMREKLRRKASTLGLVVRFTGSLDAEGVHDELARSDVLV